MTTAGGLAKEARRCRNALTTTKPRRPPHPAFDAYPRTLDLSDNLAHASSSFGMAWFAASCGSAATYLLRGGDLSCAAGMERRSTWAGRRALIYRRVRLEAHASGEGASRHAGGDQVLLAPAFCLGQRVWRWLRLLCLLVICRMLERNLFTGGGAEQ